MSPFWTDVYVGNCTMHGDWSRGTPGGCPTCESNPWPWLASTQPLDVWQKMAELERRLKTLEAAESARMLTPGCAPGASKDTDHG